MDLMKYLLVGVGSVVLCIVVFIFTKNIISGILVAVLLFGTYSLMNIIKSINANPNSNANPNPNPNKDNSTTQKNNTDN